MALTRPTFQNINTNLTTFSDSLIITNFGNVANRDIGMIYDRSQGGQSNVAVIWQESTKSFAVVYTSSTGTDTGNITTTGNANLRIGNLFAESISWANGTAFASSTPGPGASGQFQYNNASAFGGATYFNYVSGNGQIIANAGISSTSTTTGTMLVTGGIGVSGNATVNSLTVSSTATIGSTLGVTGNINGSGATLTGSMVITGATRASGGLQATPIGNASASTGQFTTASATGNVTGAALTSNASITAITTLSALGGLQNTPIGNVTPSTAIFTSESVSGNSTVSALTVNGTATIGSTLGVTGNLTIGTGTSGNIFGVNNLYANTIIGNANSTVQALTINNSATVGSTLGVTGNINGSGITLTGSLRATGTGDFDGGLQSTPIGNAAPSTAIFTSESVSGNSTVNGLTVNTSGVFTTTLQALGGLQATPIGNASPSTAIFTSESVSGNSTVSALSVNNSATIGTTLGVTGNTTVGNLTTAGNVNSNSFFTGNRGIVAFNDADSSNYVGFRAPNTVGVNLIWTLPANDGSSGYVLSTDGLGTLSWAANSGGGGGGTGGYFNSTLTAFPGASGNIDYGTGETYVGEAASVDAFGIGIVAVFSCMDPLGSLQSTDLGSV